MAQAGAVHAERNEVAARFWLSREVGTPGAVADGRL
jgi:hypothetical protein